MSYLFVRENGLHLCGQRSVSHLNREDHRSRPERPHSHLHLRLRAGETVVPNEKLIWVVVVVLTVCQPVAQLSKLRVLSLFEASASAIDKTGSASIRCASVTYLKTYMQQLRCNYAGTTAYHTVKRSHPKVYVIFDSRAVPHRLIPGVRDVGPQPRRVARLRDRVQRNARLGP